MWTPSNIAATGASPPNANGSSLPRLVQVVSTYWVVVALVCIAGILERQDPRWREVRTAIRQYGNAIAADAGDRHRILNHDEFVALRQKHVPTPVPLDLAGFGTVYLRMAHAVYPYVTSSSAGVTTHSLTHGQCSVHIRIRLQPSNIALEPGGAGWVDTRAAAQLRPLGG